MTASNWSYFSVCQLPGREAEYRLVIDEEVVANLTVDNCTDETCSDIYDSNFYNSDSSTNSFSVAVDIVGCVTERIPADNVSISKKLHIFIYTCVNWCIRTIHGMMFLSPQCSMYFYICAANHWFIEILCMSSGCGINGHYKSCNLYILTRVANIGI